MMSVYPSNNVVIPEKAGTHPPRYQLKPTGQGMGPRLRGGDEVWVEAECVA